MKIDTKQLMESNIRKYYIYNFFFLFVLFEPILFVYFQKNLSFTLTQVMIAVSFFTILTGVLEIPTGVVGDKLGYKKTLLLSAFTMLIGSIGYAISQNFYHILISEFFWAFGFSFASGTQDAFIYDSLKNLKREKEYNKVNGRATAIFWSGLAISSILGGLLAKIDLGFPVYIGFIPLIIPFIIVLTFIEPKREKKKLSHSEHIIESFKYTFGHTKLRFFLFYIIMIALILESSSKFFQPFMNQAGINIALFGFIYSFGYLISGFGSLFSHKIENYLREERLLYFIYIATFLTLLFLSISSSIIVIIGILILLLIDGIQGPIMAGYLNRNIESYNRATVNSISSLIKKISLAIMLPILGYIGQSFSINKVFLINSIIIILSFIILKKWYKRI